MIIFNHDENDVLGTITLDGERYQMRKGDKGVPDLYHWQTTSNGRKTWVKYGGYMHRNKVKRVRAEWARAGGTNEKVKKS